MGSLVGFYPSKQTGSQRGLQSIEELKKTCRGRSEQASGRKLKRRAPAKQF